MLDDRLELVCSDQGVCGYRHQTNNQNVCVGDLFGNASVWFGGVIAAHEFPPVSRNFIRHPAMFAKAG